MPTRIEWADETWNPVTGCSPVSMACNRCYARVMARRMQAMGLAKYCDGFEVRCHPGELEAKLLRAKKPKRIFVCSMGDLFHKAVPSEFIHRIFAAMMGAPQHTFMVLTKRPKRMLEFYRKFMHGKFHPSNVWYGVTVENDVEMHRIQTLRKVEARVRFVSFEPLLGPVAHIGLEGIDWAIVGGQTGPGALYMQEDWVDQVYKSARRACAAFFFKQWGRGAARANRRGYEQFKEFPK